MADVIDNGDRMRLGRLLDEATTSADLRLDERLSRSIKNVVRSSDGNVHLAHDLLLFKLKKNHAQVRYLAVLIVDQLFTRSKLFRSLLVAGFENFLQSTVGYKPENALPPPADRAALLRSKSLELVQKWDELFGQHYRQLRLGFEYLKNALRVKFPRVAGGNLQTQQQRQEKEKRTQELLRGKFQALQADFAQAKLEIYSTLDQVTECFEILAGRDEFIDHLDCSENEPLDEGDELETYGVRDLRRMHHGDFKPLASEPEEVQETQDNKPVFDILRDLYRLLRTRHVSATQDWMSILMRVEPSDRRPHDVLLKEVIDLRNSLLAVQKKCENLGIELSGNGGDDLSDVVWEAGDVSDGPKVVDDKGKQVVAASSATSTVPDMLASSSTSNDVDPKRIKGPRDELLRSAPVLPWGSYLDSWGAESAVPANNRGLMLENHWGRVDYDLCIPAEKVAQLCLRSSIFEPKKHEIPTCLAPLRKGGLCQRRDLRRCPLHGTIIPRDASGKPMFEEKGTKTDIAQMDKVVDDACEGSRTSAAAEGVEATDISLARQALANVRGKDKVDEKLERKKHQAKRDREHNDRVLRTAAISQSSQGFDEILGEAGIDDGKAQRKKQRTSLSAMLHKKPTAKDRLTKRLLNGRVKNIATAQDIRDQEATYREAFANQW